MNEAHRHAKAGRSDFTFALVDVDDFKRVNDTYGHDCGDEVLKYVAHTIMTGINKNDRVFRWGGEEICILFKAGLEHSLIAAERIRKDVEEDRINYRNEAHVTVTLTMGVAPYRDGMSVQDMMDDADAKLYWGKRHGKNQVVSVLPEGAQMRPKPEPAKHEKKRRHRKEKSKDK